MGEPSPMVGSIPVGPIVDALGSVQNALNALVRVGGISAEPIVVLAEELDLVASTDAYPPTAATSLASIGSGGTEVKFNREGIIVPGPGAIGVYYASALEAGQGAKGKWQSLLATRKIRYNREAGFFIGSSSIGGITVGGVVTLDFYAKPKHVKWSDWHKFVERWTSGSGPESAVGALVGTIPGSGGSGTDVTLGTFSDAGVGSQIFLAGTNMPSTGAVKQVSVVLNTPGYNTDAIWVAETSALAVADNNPLMPAGQDTWNIPAGGKLFFKSRSGTQKVGARVRS